MSEPGFASLGPTLLARKGGAKPAMRPQLAPLVQDEQKLAEVAEDQLEDLGWNDMGDTEPAATAGGADIVPINADVSADHMMQGPGPIVRRQQRRLEERVLADAVMTGPEDGEPEGDTEDETAYRAPYNAAEDFGAEDYDSEDDESEDYASEDYDAEEEEEEDSAQAFGEPSYAPLAAAPLRAPRKVQALAAESAPRPRPAPRPPVVVQASRRAAFTLRLDADRHLKLRLAATMQGVSAQALLTEALDAMLASFDDLDVIANHLKRH